MGEIRKINEPAQDKTYNTCVTSKDSDQSVYPPSMARVLVRTSLVSSERMCTHYGQPLRGLSLSKKLWLGKLTKFEMTLMD